MEQIKSFCCPRYLWNQQSCITRLIQLDRYLKKHIHRQTAPFMSIMTAEDNDALILRNEPASNILRVKDNAQTNMTYVKSKTNQYNNATVDNITIGGLFQNASKNFMGSVGVGIIPLLNKDESLEDAILNIMVETFIEIECISHGTNLLMSKFDKPQPNTLFTNLAVDKYKFSNKYTLAGAPAVEQ